MIGQASLYPPDTAGRLRTRVQVELVTTAQARHALERFPEAKPLRLVVSWSDSEYHRGTVYKAANFQWVRRTRGVPHGDYHHDKDCWVYWLPGHRQSDAPEDGAPRPPT